MTVDVGVVVMVIEAGSLHHTHTHFLSHARSPCTSLTHTHTLSLHLFLTRVRTQTLSLSRLCRGYDSYIRGSRYHAYSCFHQWS